MDGHGKCTQRVPESMSTVKKKVGPHVLSAEVKKTAATCAGELSSEDDATDPIRQIVKSAPVLCFYQYWSSTGTIAGVE